MSKEKVTKNFLDHGQLEIEDESIFLIQTHPLHQLIKLSTTIPLISMMMKMDFILK